MLKKLLSGAFAGFGLYMIYLYLTDRGISDGEAGFLDEVQGSIYDATFAPFESMGGGNGNMQISVKGLSHIKGWEGFESTVYLDSAGKKTIGYGHLVKPLESFSTISEADATTLLYADLGVAENAVNNAVKVPLTQGQFDALVSFVFNVGAGKFRTSTLLKMLNNSDIAGARAQFGRWIYAGGKVVNGLVNRRKGDLALFDGAQVTV